MTGGQARSEIPVVHVRGAAFDCGRQYGAQAREPIDRLLAFYERLFHHYRGWNWQEVVAFAKRFEKPIAAFAPSCLYEIAGIAEGAGLRLWDVLALNVRTEIIYGDVGAACARATSPHECSSFAVLPSRTGGRTLIGQNWDFFTGAADGVVVLEAEPDDGPAFVTLVEAGLLAKVGFNSAGVGLATNTLVGETNRGDPGVPYHVLLRALLTSRSLKEARQRLSAASMRSSAANILIAQAGGEMCDLETTAGGPDQIFEADITRDVLLHTNHFTSTAFGGVDVTRVISATSGARLSRLNELIAGATDDLDVEFFKTVLADHEHGQASICCHPNPRVAELDRVATLLSVVAELEHRRMWFTVGQPCTAEFRCYECSWFAED